MKQALALGFPAARVLTESAPASEAHPDEVRIAFDGDAVLFSDEAERIYQSGGIAAFHTHEREKARQPLPPKTLAAAMAAMAARRRCACAPRSSPPAAPPRTSAPFKR